MSSNAVIFGTDGQVARALKVQFPQATVIPRLECNFENPLQIAKVLDRHRPNLILNPAAYTNVDRAETEPEKAYLINADAPREIASWASKHDATLVQYSTDYVYPGMGDRPWKESDPTSPINLYGKSKLEGERGIINSGCRHIILRTSWIFSPQSQNFLNLMVRLGREQSTVKAVEDQFGSPTYAADLARATKQIVIHPKFSEISGVFNLANQGHTSRYEFAVMIFSILRKLKYPLKVENVMPVPGSEFKLAAQRPANCRLDLGHIEQIFSVSLRDWEYALTDCLTNLSRAVDASLH